MIRLILFAPCDQILLNDEQVPSLISILETVLIGGEISKQLPENAAIPRTWTAVALWTRTGDVKKPTEYTAKFDLVAPDGTISMAGNVDFKVSNEFSNFRNTVNFPVFPIGQPGTYMLTLSYKRKSSKSAYEKVGEFPIVVRHEITQGSNASGLTKKEVTKKPAKSK